MKKRYIELPESERKMLRSKQLEESRNYFGDLIKELDISPKEFEIKTIFRNSNYVDCVGVYATEFNYPNGLFFEIINNETYEPLDKRVVYRLAVKKYKDCYQEEFEVSTKGSYLVPLEEARVINLDSYNISKENAFASYEDILPQNVTAQTTYRNDYSKAQEVSHAPIIGNKYNNKTDETKKTSSVEDAPMTEMTIRDYAAIKLKKPISNKKWLNDIIVKDN